MAQDTTPNSRQKPNIKQQLAKNQSTVNKPEVKPPQNPPITNYRDKIVRNKSLVDEILQPPKKEEEKKE